MMQRAMTVCCNLMADVCDQTPVGMCCETIAYEMRYLSLYLISVALLPSLARLFVNK